MIAPFEGTADVTLKLVVDALDIIPSVITGTVGASNTLGFNKPVL
jgi:hypothetical protein